MRIHDAFGKAYNEYGIVPGYYYTLESSTEIKNLPIWDTLITGIVYCSWNYESLMNMLQLKFCYPEVIFLNIGLEIARTLENLIFFRNCDF